METWHLLGPAAIGVRVGCGGHGVLWAVENPEP